MLPHLMTSLAASGFEAEQALSLLIMLSGSLSSPQVRCLGLVLDVYASDIHRYPFVVLSGLMTALL
jgi:hypothetical protein